MPITKSVKKALRQSKRKKRINLKVKNAYKQAVKDVVRAESTSERAKLLSQAFSRIDKAAKKAVIHKNKAQRLKSNLSLKLSQKDG